MISDIVTATLLTWATIQSPTSDPIDAALDYHRHMEEVVTEQAQIAAQEALEERTEAADSASRSIRTPVSTGNLPPLLALIRSNESGGNYSAYNPSGCEGYGCGGAYQMHALYAPTWAEQAGYPGLGGNAATWSPSTQDAVALYLFYSTNPDGAHWCNWTDYC
jgi:hypothetical protein